MVRRQTTIRMLALGGILLPVLAWAQSYDPQGVMLEAKGFKTDKDGRIQSGKDPNAYDLQKAKDLSGIACLPPGASVSVRRHIEGHE